MLATLPVASPDPAVTTASRSYARRRPEDTLLYQAVREHLPAFLDFARERSGRELPRYVVREFQRYLECGLLEGGFLLVRCPACRRAFLVAHSCKCRGICPSCSTRRMTGLAAQLADRVIPDLPVRQFVLTVPYDLRMLLAQKADVLAAVQRLLATEVERAYLATTALGARDTGEERRGGSVTFVQRFSGSLGLHVHYHLLAADGVFVRAAPDAVPVFVPAPTLSPDTLASIVTRIHDRTLRWLRRHGHLDAIPVEDRSNEADDDDPLTSCLRVAAAQGTLATVLDPAGAQAAGDDHDEAAFRQRPRRWAATCEGFNLHAGVTVAQGHRAGLEKLVRYAARPAFALDRLSRLPDGRFAYRMKYPLHGHTHRILSPMELLARLASIVPPPRHALTRYAGVFAPASPWRPLVVPPHPPGRRCCAAHEREDRQTRAAASATPASPTPQGTTLHAPAPVGSPSTTPLPDVREAAPPATTPAATPVTVLPGANPSRIDWASLLRHGLDIDALRCPCGARMRIVAAVQDPVQVARILAHLGERTGRVPSRAWDPLPCADADLPAGDWN